MKTDSLIQKLASRASPLNPLPPPPAQLAGWFAVASLYVALGVAWIGARSDTAEDFTRPGFVIQVFLPLLVSLASAASAFALGIPNRKDSWPPIATFSALGACAASLAYLISSAHAPHAGAGLNCIRNLILLGLPPALLFNYLLRKAAPLRLNLVAMMAIVGSSALACSATRFICPNEDALHFFVWHFLPVLLLGAIGFGLGAALFKRRPQAGEE